MADLIFTKYSNERSRRFAIRTDIMEETDGGRFVRKTALHPEGQKHVEMIYHWYKKLEELYGEEFFSFNKGRMEKGSLRLDYVKGQTLEEVLDDLCVQGETEAAADMLRQYLKKIKTMYSAEAFVMTDNFREVFGDVRLPEGFLCGPVTNIDLVCSNLAVAKEETILDYEWTFAFPIPCEFVLYRIIRYCQDPYSARRPLCAMDFYSAYGITEELQDIFLEMELKFQDYITGGHVPMREMYEDMTPGSAPLQMVPAEQLQIFFDKGEDYSQENSRTYPIKDQKVSVKLSLPSGCRQIRLDPGDNPCAVSISRLTIDGAAVSLERAVIEGGLWSGRWVYIAKTDPFIANIPVPQGAGELIVSLHVYPVEQKVLEGMCRQLSGQKPKITNGKRLLAKVKNRFRG